ncbi:protein ENL-like [Anticarsia gemmatalis]|uniref:protein ENL-like n=1 Tax=Anticarsia gemmatalis TaxID=129554 RepID=UPI003F767C0F
MTEGSLLHHDKPMCVRIWLEVGHECKPRRSALGRALALDWSVWVRGVSGHDISAFVHKVVFHLHPPTAFVYPKRVLQEPPYEIQESGCASIDIPIHVYLKYSNRPKKIRLRYSLQIENNNESNSESHCVYYDFENPSEQLCKAIMSGGGEVVARTGAPDRSKKLLVVLSDSGDDKPHKVNNPKKYKFVEPIQCKHGPKKRTKSYLFEEICSKCGNSIYVDFRKQLRSVAMTDDEINCVSQLYLSYTSYEKSEDPLILPAISDPIYEMPVLPPALRKALKKVEDDYTML